MKRRRLLLLGSIGLLAGVLAAGPVMFDRQDFLPKPQLAMAKGGPGSGGEGGHGSAAEGGHGSAAESGHGNAAGNAAGAAAGSGAGAAAGSGAGAGAGGNAGAGHGSTAESGHGSGDGGENAGIGDHSGAADAGQAGRTLSRVPSGGSPGPGSAAATARGLPPIPAGGNSASTASSETVDRLISSLIGTGAARHRPPPARAQATPVGSSSAPADEIVDAKPGGGESAGSGAVDDETVDRVLASIEAHPTPRSNGARRPAAHHGKNRRALAAAKSTRQNAKPGELDNLIAWVVNDLSSDKSAPRPAAQSKSARPADSAVDGLDERAGAMPAASANMPLHNEPSSVLAERNADFPPAAPGGLNAPDHAADADLDQSGNLDQAGPAYGMEPLSGRNVRGSSAEDDLEAELLSVIGPYIPDWLRHLSASAAVAGLAGMAALAGLLAGAINSRRALD